MEVSFDNVHFYEAKLKVDVDKLGGERNNYMGASSYRQGRKRIYIYREREREREMHI